MTEAAKVQNAPNILSLTAEIVSAHLAGNKVEADTLPGMIASVYGALSSVGKEPVAPPSRPQPAVSVKKSIQHDHLVCLEDGAKVTMLKRYIAKRFNLTPVQYRARWGLVSDYPMVAPAYAARRSVLAKENGLGRKAAPVLAKAAPRKVGRLKGSKALASATG